MSENYCACGLRLSIADPGNLCLECAADRWQPPAKRVAALYKYDAQGNRLCRCERGLVVAYRPRCAQCNSEQVSAWRKQHKRRSAALFGA